MTEQESESLSLYEQVLLLTEQMQSAALEDNWTDVAELEAKRAGHIEALRSLDAAIAPGRDYITEKRRLLESAVQLDQLLVSTCAERRSEYERILQLFSTEKKAAKAYDDNR